MSHEICIDGFPPTVTAEELKILFSECGPVLSVDLVRSVEGSSMGVARLQMESSEAAENAVRMFNRAKLDGRTLLVFSNSTITQTDKVDFTPGRNDCG